MPFGTAAPSYNRLRFLPSAEEAVAEISRVLHDGGRLAVSATSVDTRVGWVRDMFTDAGLRAQERGNDSARNVTLPSDDFSPAEEIVFSAAQNMHVTDIVAWFRTHSTYLNGDESAKKVIEHQAAGLLREVFPDERTVEVPVATLCWRAERQPR